MEVSIGEITSSVHALDGSVLLTPEVEHRIRQLALEVVRAYEAHREQLQVEQQINRGVFEELVERRW